MTKPNVRCAGCGKPMVSVRPQGAAKCNPCSSGHGSQTRYKRGCRCVACKDGAAERARRFNDRWRSEHGVNYTTWLRAKRAEESGEVSHRWWVSRERRLAIYERDGWICQLCMTPTLRAFAPGDELSPSLDHIVPRSLGGSHEDDNLRLCHIGCNARRGAAVEVDPPETFRSRIRVA